MTTPLGATTGAPGAPTGAPEAPTTSRNTGAATAAGLTLVAGLWYIASPWVYGAGGNTWSVWNNEVVGILIAWLAGIRLSRSFPSFGARWADLILGIWVLFSPWIYGYVASEARFINSVCVGAVVFVLALWGLAVSRRTTPPQL